MAAHKIWSCKIKRPETLRSHRSLNAATKRAGDHGFVYDPEHDTVYQVMTMAGGRLKRFDTKANPKDCNTGGFDMREAMVKREIPTPAK